MSYPRFLFFLLLFLLAFSLVGGATLVKISFGVRTHVKRLKNEGKRVTGKLIQLSPLYRDLRFAIVSYTVNEQAYLIQRPISPTHFSWEKDMPLEVKYLPAKPNIAFLVEDTFAEAWGYWLLIAILSLIFAVMLLVGLITLWPLMWPSNSF